MRMKIGQMFGNPETTTGGNALKFYASVRIDIRKIETLTKASEPYGTTARVKVVKNKMAPPFKKAEFDLIFGEGISQGGCIIELGVEDGIIEKSGTWYSYGAEKLGQGKENVKNYLTEHPDISIEIENKIRLKHNLKTIKASEIKGKAAPDEEKTVEKETKKSKSSAKASDAEEQMELSPEIYKSEQKKNEEN
jgi:recombination protein RecA